MPSKLTAARSWLIACMLLFTTISFAQQKTVTGKIVSEKDKQPVFGATVSVKGSTTATQTAQDGSFTISVPNANSVLVVSFVGFESIEVPVGNKSSVDISLKDKSTTLTDVVVTGYSSQAKKDITASVSVVKTEDLKSIPAANAESQLQGRVSGVTVTTNNRPGDGATVRIRGFATLTGENSPLIIIDGVPGSLTGLNPNDIDQMQVLKDAAGASIYGSRASNGVIIVTTKKGKQGSAKVTYNMYYGNQYPGKGYTNLLNPTEMMDLAFLAKRNQGLPLKHDQYAPTGGTPRLPDYLLAGTASGLMEGDPLTDPSKYNLNLDNVSGSYLIVKANKAGTNWFKELTEVAPIMNHNINVSGGSDRSRYLFSFDYFDQKGIVLHNFFKRYTARINTEFNVKKNIRIGENLQLTVSQGNGAGLNDEGTEIANSYRAQSIVPVYNVKGDFAGSRGANLGNGGNPVAARIRSKDNRGNNYGIFGNMYAEVDFLKHFTARTSLGGTISNDNYYSYTFQSYENAENNSGTSLTEGSSTYRSWIWNNQLTYKNTFGEHDITVLAGTEAVEEWGRAIQGVRLGYFVDNPDFRSLDAGGASGQRATGSPYTPNSLFSYYGKFDYSFRDKFLAGGTVRRDGSSKFGANNRYAIFPAFSVGWRISEESFLQNVKWLTDLKLKGSWGQMGSQFISPSNQFTQFSSGPGSSNYDINGNQNSTVGGFQQSFIGNPDGKWEVNTTSNIGFEATLFNGKTEIIAEWYDKSTSDLLFRLEGVATGGVASGSNPNFKNVAGMKNTGIDLLITQRANIGGSNGVKLDATFTFTTYTNKITKLAEGIDFFDAGGNAGRVGGTFFRNSVGQAVSAFYGYKVIGIFQDAAEVSKSPTQDAAAPGRFKYLDANKDGAITSADRVFFGNPNPDFTYGLNLNLAYKAFDATLFFYGAQGRDLINYVKWWTDFVPSFQGAKSKAALYNSFVIGGDPAKNAKATVPVQEESGNFSTNGVPNSYYMEDGSYLRMKNISIGYSLPSSVLNRFKIERFRIYAQATNLFTLTKYSGLDVEVTGGDTQFGSDAGSYPTVKQFYIGVNVGF